MGVSLVVDLVDGDIYSMMFRNECDEEDLLYIGKLCWAELR